MTERSSLAHQVERLTGTAVLCAGDVMVDRFISGEVTRISPEAPVPVVAINTERVMLGGAGNVARNLSALGADALFLSVTGDDRAGQDVVNLLTELDHTEPYLSIEPGRTTTIKNRFFAGSQQLLRADRETTDPISQRTCDDMLSTATRMADRLKAIVLSDYAKGVLTPEVCRGLIGLAKELGIPVVVDPKGSDYARYDGATVLTPNRKELAVATGASVASDESITQAAQDLRQRLGCAAILVTRGRDGMTLVTENDVRHLPAAELEVYDVSGAGDTVAATYAAALGAGLNYTDAAELANTAAGIVVGKVGTAVTSADDLVAALHHLDLTRAEAKRVSLTTAVETAERWRRKGHVVGFTNGCFDLVHPGHVSLLSQAREACDKLIVGLNSDASVKRLKGPERPIQSEGARAQVLASMEQVDLVVVFDEDTPANLIGNIVPEVLVKGADYTKDQVVGADVVEAAGGRVVLARLEEAYSTTATIASLKQGTGS